MMHFGSRHFASGHFTVFSPAVIIAPTDPPQNFFFAGGGAAGVGLVIGGTRTLVSTIRFEDLTWEEIVELGLEDVYHVYAAYKIPVPASVLARLLNPNINMRVMNVRARPKWQ